MSQHDPQAGSERRQRRALSHVGGLVHARGDQELSGRLATAFDIETDEESTRAHVHGFHSYPARMHPTVARRMIELLSEPGATVLDPFCGSGTVLVEGRIAGRLPLLSRIPTEYTPMPLSEAVDTPPNYFHAYQTAGKSSPSIVTWMP